MDFLPCESRLDQVETRILTTSFSNDSQEGLFTVIFGVALFFVLPRDPQGCKFLTQEERNMIDRRLAADVPPGTAISQGDRFSWREVKIACTSPQVILVVIALFGNGESSVPCGLELSRLIFVYPGMTLYALAYFAPPIVQTFGYSPITTQLLSVPPFFCAFLLTLVTAWFSDRYAQRGLCAIAMSVLALVGYIMFYKSLLTSVRYVALFLAISGVYSVTFLEISHHSSQS